MLNISADPTEVDIKTPIYKILLACNLQKPFTTGIPENHYKQALSEIVSLKGFDKVISVCLRNNPDSPLLKNKVALEGDYHYIFDGLEDLDVERYYTDDFNCVTEEVFGTLVSLTDSGFENNIQVTLIGFNAETTLYCTAMALVQMGIKVDVIPELCGSTKGEGESLIGVSLIKKLKIERLF